MKTYKDSIGVFSIKKEKTSFLKAKITSSKDAADFIRQFYGDDMEVYESFYLLLLNRQNITEGYVKILQGGTAGTVTDIKIILKYAIDSLASGVIIAHNHPSGNLQPSESGITVTRKTKDALLLVDIKLLDHIIMTADNFHSFADNGLVI